MTICRQTGEPKILILPNMKRIMEDARLWDDDYYEIQQLIPPDKWKGTT